MIFAFIALLIVFFMNYYVYKALISLLILPSFLLNIFKILLIFMTIIELAFVAFFRHKAFTDFLYIFSASLLGISFILFFLALIYDVFYLAICSIPFHEDRREFFKKLLTYLTLVVSFSYILRAFWCGIKKPIIKNITIEIKNLKQEISIVQLSDIHMGRNLQKDFLEDLVKRTNELKPDFIAITGDLVDLEIDKIKNDLLPLEDLKSRYGTFFVAGNHEYYHGIYSILSYLKKLNINVLENEGCLLGGIYICGVYDEVAFSLNHPLKPDIQKALRNNDEKLPTILLAHQPKYINKIPLHKVDLVLSGHTHGGQIFPFGLLVRLVQPYLHGLYRHDKNTQIYVSSGAGYWGPPLRFLAQSEIVNIKLVAKKG